MIFDVMLFEFMLEFDVLFVMLVMLLIWGMVGICVVFVLICGLVV